MLFWSYAITISSKHLLKFSLVKQNTSQQFEDLIMCNLTYLVTNMNWCEQGYKKLCMKIKNCQLALKDTPPKKKLPNCYIGWHHWSWFLQLVGLHLQALGFFANARFHIHEGNCDIALGTNRSIPLVCAQKFQSSLDFLENVTLH